MLTYLYQLTSLFQDYFTTLNEESIRDNFVIIYELLDETMDHGLPQSLDSTILRQFITQEGNRMADDSKNKPPVALTNAVSWRAEGIKHKKNEIFLDVVEKLNLLVAEDLLFSVSAIQTTKGPMPRCDAYPSVLFCPYLSL